jgi:hypothetical protein
MTSLSSRRKALGFCGQIPLAKSFARVPLLSRLMGPLAEGIERSKQSRIDCRFQGSSEVRSDGKGIEGHGQCLTLNRFIILSLTGSVLGSRGHVVAPLGLLHSRL